LNVSFLFYSPNLKLGAFCSWRHSSPLIRGAQLHYVSGPSQSTFNQESLLYDFEERIAIAEYDGHQSPIQARRIAYLDAFISILSTLAEDDPYQDWLSEKIQIALATLEAQNFPTLN